MSFLAYCLLLTLYLHASSARRIGIVEKRLYDQKYLIFGKGMVQDRVENEQHQKSLSLYSATTSISEEEGKPQGKTITSSPHMVLEEGPKIKELKIQARRILLEPKRHDHAEETVDSKGKNDHVVVEDVVVMDYAQPHRKQPIHNRDP